MKKTAMPTDIEIAQSAKLRPISEIALELGLSSDDIEPYGHYKAKIRLEVLGRTEPKARMVLVTATSPTAAGEGKTTVTVGLTQALQRLGHKTIACIREPSLGPVFGIKGGAAGGGYSQVLPMEDINLHFTGDMHAVTTAHMLLSAALDNHLHQGNPLGLDPRRITWKRTLDMNDRALRQIVVGLGGPTGGIPREDGYVITAASEVMAILCLAADAGDLERRLGDIIVGQTYDRRPVRARDLEVQGAMTLLLLDALKPNLVQTLEGGPAVVHGGPFGNIAQGCNSILGTKMALRLADLVVTEAGFGSDLGAEKFFDIKCRLAGFQPQAVVLVTTVRALKWNGGLGKNDLAKENLEALEAGIPNLDKHIENVQTFGVPLVVALNRFPSDTPAEIKAVLAHCEKAGVQATVADVFAQGGEGGEDLAKAVVETLDSRESDFQLAYELDQPIKDKIHAIATRIYGADGVDYTSKAEKSIEQLKSFGLGEVPICIAKTQYSLSDDPALLGRPRGFRVQVQDVVPAAGAGFLVALAGSIMRMPGLPRVPAANGMKLRPDGKIEGLA
jgi:formate--tetrahydrofolate ligase